MSSVFLFAAANLRRHKGAAVSLGVMTLIASLLLNLGLLSLTSFPTLVSRKIDELNTPYLSVVLSDQIGASEQASYEELISGSAGVTGTQSEPVLYFPSATFSLNDSGDYSNAIILQNAAAGGKMGPLRMIGPSGSPSDDSIYVPFILKAKGYRIGDGLTLSYKGKAYRFTVAGFTEDILLGSLNTGGARFYLPDASYRKFERLLNTPETRAILFSARTNTMEQASGIYDSVLKRAARSPADAMRVAAYSIDIIEMADSMPVEIGSAMEIGFAFLVALVLLLVVRFRIVNSIEQEMRNIGALEAVGYTNRQVRGGFVIQFLITAVLGSVTGIALSYAAAKPYGQMLATETGINWTQPFDPVMNLLTLAVIAACVLLVSALVTRRIRRLPVIEALRGGIATHSFRRNYLPLARSRGPLSMLLAFKSVFTNVRQNVALAVILAFVSFASVFIFMMFYNFTIDNTAVIQTMGGETDDILIGAKSPGDAQTLLSEIPRLTGVSQAIDFGNSTVEVDGKTGYGRLTADYGKLQNNQCYKGRYPLHDNEAAIGGLLAAQLHKGVGDTIRISSGSQSGNYLITGLTQSMSTLGKGVFLTDEGNRRINPQYEPALIYVYVTDGTNVDDVIKEIRTRYADRLSAITNDRAATKSMLGTYQSVVATFAVSIFAVMALIVVLILALITSSTLVRRRKDFGIEKALGFTTWQLICQVSIGFLQVAALGSFAGGVLGWLEANTLMSFLFRSMGIMKVNFFLPALSVPAVCAAIVLLTLFISMAAASRIGRISTCVLMGE